MPLILTIAIIDIIGISLIVVFHKEILYLITGISKNIGNFIIENSGFFTILFLTIFFLEQILLILLVFYIFDAPPRLQMWISIFALIVVTTATLQKFIWEYKYQSRSREIIDYSNEYNMVLSDIGILIDENKNLRNKLKNLKKKER